MATRRSTTTQEQMATRGPGATSTTISFTSDQIRSIRILPAKQIRVPKARSGITARKIIVQPPPPPPPFLIEVKLKSKPRR